MALVVDDNPDITAMLAAVLRHTGYTVSLAHSATDALALALSRHFVRGERGVLEAADLDAAPLAVEPK